MIPFDHNSIFLVLKKTELDSEVIGQEIIPGLFLGGSMFNIM